MMTVKIQA